MKRQSLAKDDIYYTIGSDSMLDSTGIERKYAWSFNEEEQSYFLILINPQGERMVHRHSTNGQDWRPKPFKTLDELHTDFKIFCEEL